jgi:HD superfamily phosphohydrolase
MDNSTELPGSLEHQLPLLRQRQFERRRKTFRVAISGDVALTDLEVKIVDSPDFRRLRRIRQLGTVHLVYSSAQHTRFEHSLGSLQVAERMVRLIRENPHSSDKDALIAEDEHRLIRLAALLPDVANVPFGHTLEDETRVLVTGQEGEERYNHFIGEGSNIGRLLLEALGRDGYELLIRILTTKRAQVPLLREHAFMSDIVKNTVCSDLLDYLYRDAYCCFLNLGFGDRFLDYLFIASRDEEIDGKRVQSRRLAIRLWRG